jgi:hypothetical protein
VIEKIEVTRKEEFEELSFITLGILEERPQRLKLRQPSYFLPTYSVRLARQANPYPAFNPAFWKYYSPCLFCADEHTPSLADCPSLKRPSCDLTFEKLALEQGYRRIAGIDEVGRGALFGPVCAAAVVLDIGAIPRGINDSKKLSAKKRLQLAEDIRAEARDYAIALLSLRSPSNQYPEAT